MKIDLLYTEKIHIIDRENYINTEFPNKPKEFFVKFAEKVEVREKKDIFSKSQAKSISKKYNKDTINVNVILPRFLTLANFKYLLASIFEIHIDAIDLNYDNYLNDSRTIEQYENTSCINKTKFNIKIKPSSRPRINGYEKLIMPIIEKYEDYFQDINTDERFIEQFIVQLSYVMFAEDVKDIDIIRLFNINSTSKKYSKICLHSDELNDFRNESNPLACKVKCKDRSLRPLQGLKLSRNECSFLHNFPITNSEYIRLYNISVLKNGQILFMFKIYRDNNDYDKLNSLISSWMKKNAIKYIEDIHLDECVYNLKFDYNKFKFTNISHTIYAKVKSKDKLKSLNVLNSIPFYKPDYDTKSSIREAGFQSHSISTQELLNRVLNIAPTLQQVQITIHFLCTVHINSIDDGFMIEIRDSASIENSNLIIQSILAKLDLKSKETKPKKEPKIKIDEFAKFKSSLQEVDPKIRIKQLKELDPLIFGSRERKGKGKDYSQLVQINEQRPSILMESEYKMVKKIEPNSVLNVENQLTHERLYLYCPYEKFPVINYHAEKDQLCIIKCTSNYANAPQFFSCNKQLNGIGNEKTLDNKYFSNTIIKFSPTLEEGRRCFPPDEILNVLPYSHLLKCPKTSEIARYLKEIKSIFIKPCIISRFDGYYEIKEDIKFLGLKEMVLVIQIENSDDYYLVCDNETNSPIIFSSSDHNMFIEQLIKISAGLNTNEKFVEYMNHLTKNNFPLNTKVTDLINQLFIKEPKEKILLFKYKTQNNMITQILYHKKIWPIPPIFDLNFVNALNIYRIEEEYLPEFKDLDITKVTKIYKDFSHDTVVMVEYFGLDAYIKEAKIDGITLPTEYIDGGSMRLNLLDAETEAIPKISTKSTLYDANNLLLILLNLYLRNKKIFNIDMNEFVNYISPFISDKIEINYIEGGILSWRNSKLSKQFIKKIPTKKEYIMKLLYEFISDNCKIVYDNTREFLYEALVY